MIHGMIEGATNPVGRWESKREMCHSSYCLNWISEDLPELARRRGGKGRERARRTRGMKPITHSETAGSSLWVEPETLWQELVHHSRFGCQAAWIPSVNDVEPWNMLIGAWARYTSEILLTIWWHTQYVYLTFNLLFLLIVEAWFFKGGNVPS